MNNKMVSIVIPVYNLQNYLEECIQSLINQSWKDIEILLIDDGSTDNSSVLCDDLAKKDKRIRVLHKKNGGVSSARNAGISMAKGEYITFIDGDDWVSEKYIETLYHLITSYSADVVASGFFYTYETGVCKKVQLVTEVATISGMDALNQACDIQTPWVGFACGKLVKTEVLLKYKFHLILKSVFVKILCFGIMFLIKLIQWLRVINPYIIIGLDKLQLLEVQIKILYL